MNILTDILSLLKRKKYVETAKPDDVLVLGIHEEPDILGIASPVPYKDARLIKIKDLATSGDCIHTNIPEAETTIAGVYKDMTTVDDECYINLRRLKSLSLDLTIVENGDFIDFDLTIDDLLNVNVLTVTKSGDDTTAAVQKYDFHKPWANPTVAMAAAVSGDIVIVYPGTYTIGVGADVTDDGSQQMVKDGVILYMMPGALIQYTNATGTISLPFSDGGAFHKIKIRGKGQFIFNADTSTATDFFNLTTHGSTTVDWEFDSIFTKRRFGGPIAQTPDFAIWRMVGRQYINSESGIFQFEFPVTSTNKFIDIDIEKVTITYNNALKPTWTVNKLMNLSTGSIVNIRYGKVSYPNAVNDGGFHENDTCDKNSIINLTIDNITRTNGIDTFVDYIVYHNTDASKGTYTIKNINTNKGLIKSNAITGEEACRTAYLHGNIGTVTNETIDMYLMDFDAVDLLYKIEMDLVHSGTGEYDKGIYAKDSWRVKLSGVLKWANTIHEPINVEVGAGVKSLTLWNFMLSEVGHIYCARNISAGAVDIHVMNTFSTKAINAGGGGSFTLTQRIGTITVDPLV